MQEQPLTDDIRLNMHTLWDDAVGRYVSTLSLVIGEVVTPVWRQGRDMTFMPHVAHAAAIQEAATRLGRALNVGEDNWTMALPER